MESLDPRVNRLPHVAESNVNPKNVLDQLTTFEVFVQPKPGKPFQHEGIVHAADQEMAYVLAKETFTRRFTCSAIAVVDTALVWVSPTTEGDHSAYDLLPPRKASNEPTQLFEIFHLLKRGKQHIHAGTVEADNAANACHGAASKLRPDKPVYNIWAIHTTDLRFTTPEESDLWITLPEKKFRDAADYKGGDKLKAFLEKGQVK